MASSFADQIPTVLHLIQKLNPTSVLDVGKGFGKYGFLIHEYQGIALDKIPDPTRTLAELSRIEIHAVEVQESFLFPHIPHIYSNVFVGKIEDLYASLPKYDVVLMTDVIEHLEKCKAQVIVKHFLRNQSILIISTPQEFFHQHLCGSPYEEHVSHWTVRDMRHLANFMDYQNCGAGRVFVLSNGPVRVRGFGNSILAKGRRIARLIVNEF